MQNLNELTDRELYEKCSFFGTQTRKWANKFAALLPEVEKRALYKKYGFYSIFEFAAKLARMSRETVIEILRVSKKLEAVPLLREQIETQGWSKLKVVATIATKENEKMLAEKVCEMSKGTLAVFVNEMRKQNNENVQIRPGAEGHRNIDDENAQVANAQPSRIHVRLLLKPKTELRLKELQKKMSKKIGAPVDLNEVMEALLDAYDNREAPKRARKANTQIVNRPIASDIGTPSRYIPAAIKKVLYSKYGGRCAFPGCNKLPDIYHHTRRFSLHPNHNPDFLTPLCHAHEQLAHHGLIENEEHPAENWRLQLEPDKSAAKYWVDRKVRGFRRDANNG
ncbi:MAG: hypothetical protein WCT53_03265 [Candidatus Gracilibacteria bacterium]